MFMYLAKYPENRGTRRLVLEAWEIVAKERIL